MVQCQALHKSSTSSSHYQKQQLQHATTAAATAKATSTATKPHLEHSESSQEILKPQSGLNERVEKAIQSTVDQVSPCPIEPKDGNKAEGIEVGVEEEVRWREQTVKLSELSSIYMQLSKSRLTSKYLFYSLSFVIINSLDCAIMLLYDLFEIL